MTNTQIIQVFDLPALVESPDHGPISLVGIHGGRALIAGEVYASNIVEGAFAIEIEHGTLYIDAESYVEVLEDDPLGNDQHGINDISSPDPRAAS